MKIKLRLTFLYTLLITAFVITFAMVIYISNSANRSEEYYKRLRQEAITQTEAFLDTSKEMKMIYKNSSSFLSGERVEIYDSNLNLLYGNTEEGKNIIESKQLLTEIAINKEIEFTKNEIQEVGFLYEKNGRQYKIIAIGIDNHGLSNLSNIKYTLIISIFFSIVITFFVSLFFSSLALKPFSKITENVKKISASNLNLRLFESQNKDEIRELSVTFNQMLERLEKSFDAQKEFVSNVSHELRTPLTAMITELQLSLSKERSNENYKEAIKLAINDAQKLEKLSREILDLARVNYDGGRISFKELRLDEVLFDARNYTMHNNNNYNVSIIYEREIENDNLISIYGNEYLLGTAFTNIMENGCKFSNDNKCIVTITYNNGTSILHFQDAGICIPQKDYDQIFTPFYRCVNKKYINGHGIGLTLVKKVIQLHKGEISVSSRENESTVFTVEIPHL